METNANTASVAQKSRTAYLFLGLFLGGWGIHNFYAGRKKYAFIQLGLTVIALITSVLAESPGAAIFTQMMIMAVWIWVLIEIFKVKKDGQGNPFK